MKTLRVSIDNWREIRKRIKELSMKHNNDVISYLFDIEKKYKSSEFSIGKKTSGENDKKELQNDEDDSEKKDKQNNKNNDMWDI